jgi:uroporphyrinogen decarboxylase
MTDEQWDSLLRVIDGELLSPPPIAFLVDGPWYCGVSNCRLMDYFLDNQVWLRANLAAAAQFPDITWLPGFWSEFGMISNPPSFGAKCVWPEEGFPTCEPALRTCMDVDGLQQPNVRTDGLLPLLIQKTKQCLGAIEAAGHRIRFACSHGPITIASYLLGHNEFFLACRTEPDAINRLLEVTTQFVIDWLVCQKQEFPSIDGVLILEDLMGFVGEEDFQRLVLRRMQKIFDAVPVSVRFLHNDAFGLITARHLAAMHVNLFNFSFEHSIQEIRQLAGEGITLMGNVPPRDVLGQGTVEDVRRSVTELLESIPDWQRVILSAGGFTPGAFTQHKIEAFRRAAATV